MAEEQKRGGIGGIGDGIRTGIGILNSLREAVEETFQEAVERGDISQDRAKQAMRDATQRFQTVLEEARERIDVVPRREFEELRAEVAALRERVARLEGAGAGGDDAPGIIITG